jgi:ribosomal protein S18 acetylase RimI-like enzyme
MRNSSLVELINLNQASMLIREAVFADAGSLASVHVDTWRTTYAGIVPDEVLAGFAYAVSERRWRARLRDRDDGSKTYVAEEDDGVVAGFVVAGPAREAVEGYDGEIYAIYVSAEHQGRGCGRELMAVAARHLLVEGFQAMMLWVLSDNAACRFYERLGGIQLAEKSIEIGGISLTEVAYGWRNPEALVTVPEHNRSPEET